MLRLLPQHLPRLAFVCWLLQRVNWILICVISMPSKLFVQSNLEDMFLRLPQGCDNMSGNVERLNRSLYGLKQASPLVAVICSPA